MSPAKESIIDATIPSAGRIYDYFLGGHHNFEVDRRAGDQILANLPWLSKLSRLQRWCLQDIARELTEVRGYTAIVDFASGLPTQDHIHTVVPAGTKVIYSDYDPVVVEYAREILGDTPDVYFFEADASRPQELLNRPEVQSILGGARDVGLVYWGIGGFLSDDQLGQAARALHEWAGEKSCWAFNAQGADGNPNTPEGQAVLKLYAQMRSPFTIRPMNRYLELLAPWRPDASGFISFLEWHGFDSSILSPQDLVVFGSAGTGYGGYLIP